jgi:hypothetical protein
MDHHEFEKRRYFQSFTVFIAQSASVRVATERESENVSRSEAISNIL